MAIFQKQIGYWTQKGDDRIKTSQNIRPFRYLGEPEDVRSTSKFKQDGDVAFHCNWCFNDRKLEARKYTYWWQPGCPQFKTQIVLLCNPEPGYGTLSQAAHVNWWHHSFVQLSKSDSSQVVSLPPEHQAKSLDTSVRLSPAS